MVSIIDCIYPIDTWGNGFLEIAGLILLIVMPFAALAFLYCDDVMMTSTRRFASRPSSVRFVATGER